MKTSSAYIFTAVLAVNVTAECVEGTRQEISPGYVVIHRCGMYRQGEPAIKDVNSEAECAAHARDAGANASTYHAVRRQCRIARPDGKDLPYAGATFLERVEEEPEDPFPVTCEDENDFLISEIDALIGERDSLKADLERCQADSKASNKPSTCGVDKWGVGYYKQKIGYTITQCKKECDADAMCRSYSANKGTTGAINCYLYEKVTDDVPDRKYPNFAQYDKNCP